MAGRLSLLLRGVGNAFGLQLRMSKLWEQEASVFLNKHGHQDQFPAIVEDSHSLHDRKPVNNSMVITSTANASGTFPDKNDMKLINRRQKLNSSANVTLRVGMEDGSMPLGAATPDASKVDSTDENACPMSGKKGGKCPWGFGSATTA